MMVSLIQSNYMGFGSGVVVPGTGISLQNRGTGFSLQPGHPNEVAGGKRPFHTIIPAFMERGDQHIGFGIMGGANQPLAHAQFVSNIADYGMNIQEAVNAPRFHNQWLPDVVNVEKWTSPDTLNALRTMGYKIQIGLGVEGGSPYWSDAECIAIDEKTGLRLGATDVRNSTGKAVGY